MECAHKCKMKRQKEKEKKKSSHRVSVSFGSIRHQFSMNIPRVVRVVGVSVTYERV